MSSQPKPHFKKVKCIIYWYPEDIEGHAPVPGWQVTPYRAADDDHFYGGRGHCARSLVGLPKHIEI